jgi:hypothetical protein
MWAPACKPAVWGAALPGSAAAAAARFTHTTQKGKGLLREGRTAPTQLAGATPAGMQAPAPPDGWHGPLWGTGGEHR